MIFRADFKVCRTELGRKAMAYTINRKEVCFDLAGSEVLPHLAQDRAVQSAYLGLAHDEFYDGYLYFDAIIGKLSEADRNAFYAKNRALAALGEDADHTQLSDYTSWEEAVLAKTATRDEMEAGRELGLSPQGYRQMLARLQREAELREQEAAAAIQSGDKKRIKRALQAISLDRWLEHVATSNATTSGDIVEALAAGPGSRWRRELQARQARFQEEARRAAPQRHYGSSGGYTSSTFVKPDNSF